MMMNSTNIEASTKLNRKQFKVFQSYFANSNSSSNHSCFQASKLFTDEYYPTASSGFPTIEVILSIKSDLRKFSNEM